MTRYQISDDFTYQDLLSFIFQRSCTDMKSKWKCLTCNKILATKQNIEKHIEKLHPDCNRTQQQYTVVQVSSDENNPEKKQSKGKSAYAYFSGMKNIFSHKDLCKNLNLYSETSARSVEDQTLDDTAASNNPNIEDKKTEAGTVHSEDQNPSKDDGTLPEVCGTMNSPPSPVNLETHYDLFISELDTAFEESPPPTPISEEPPQIDLEDMTPPSSLPGSLKFKPPFKTRGGCGCEKCNRENCGNCYNCLNRSKTK